jgi:hypothetical protein
MGVVCVELSQDFRANAAECLKLSQEASSRGAQSYWLAMAQFWFQLAQHAEDREAIESVNPAMIGPPNDDRVRKPGGRPPNSLRAKA